MRRTTLVVVTLLSMTLLALELIWTRLFSAEFFYTFAFLILSLAIMGLGLGALALRLFPALNRQGSLGIYLSLTALFAIAGPPVVFLLGLDFSVLFSSPVMILKLVAAILLMSATWFAGGLALARVFRLHHTQMPRLYMADLLGAGLGVVGAVVAMNRLGTPAAAFHAALPALLAAFIVTRGRWKLAPLVLAAGVGVLSGHGELLDSRGQDRAPVIYRHWDAMAKLKVYDFGGHYRGINIDNVANTPVIPFDGNWEAADTTESEWDIDVGWLVDQFDDCTFMSLGAGGGMDVLQALDHGAAEIHAVEVNGHINRMMLDGDPGGYVSRDSAVVDSTGRIVTCAEYSGYIYRDPRVRVVTEDARTYVRRHPATFDVIYSLSSNTWAALGSGAFALAETYIFTTEAFEDYWRALTPGGFMSMEHQVYVPRLVSEVIDALENVGVEEPRDHFAVYNLPKLRRKLILISKRPLTDEIRNNAFRPLTPERFPDFHLLYPCADSLGGNLVNRIVVNGWEAEQDSADIDLSPATDDRPFVAQMGLWKNFDRGKLDKVSRYAEFYGFPLSRIMVLIILGVVVALLIPLNLVPYLRPGPKLRAVPWLYFFAIGVAFISVEVVLIQKYTLFIGASVYSTATVLLVLLAASGLGSRFSERARTPRVFGGIVVWLLAEAFLFRTVTNALADLELPMRLAVSAALILPAGFLMGMPFPKGALRVKDLVDWGFAVNGAASVLGATGVVVVATAYGFTAALLCAAGCYLLAWLLLSREKLW